MNSDLFHFWQERGLSTRTARALADYGLVTDEEVRAFGPAQFLRSPKIGKKSAREIERLIGWIDPHAEKAQEP